MRSEVATTIILTLFLATTLTTAFGIAHTANELPVHNTDTDLHYETIQDAISAPETSDGHTIKVDAGIYSEHVTVDKSLKLVGEGGGTTIIDGGGTGTVINVIASNVDIGGFTVRNSGPSFDDRGISLDHSSNTIIGGNILTNNTWDIWLKNATDNTISKNRIQNSTYSGIYLGDSTNNSINRNTMTNNCQCGMWLERSDNNAITRNNMIQNGMGIALAIDANNNTVSGNTITDNDEGIHLFSSSNNIFENTITANWYGIFSLHSGGNIIYRNNFIENTKQTYLNESYVDIWDNGFEGNHWSDYEGQDLDGDGVGDTLLPHQGLDHYPLMEPWSRFRIFDVTWEEETYHVTTFSNSTIASFSFNLSIKQISLNVSGPSGAVGFCNITIPKSLLRGPWLVLVDEENATASTIIAENATHTLFHLSCGFSTCTVTIIGTTVLDKSPPVANAGPNQTVDEDILMTFNGSGSYDNFGITSYTWTFTDETQQTLTGVSPTYTFANPGTYTVALNVSDGAGHYAADTVVITVLDVTDPVADAGSGKMVTVYTDVGFDASGSSDNVGIISYEWDFGDGFNGTGITTTHTYTEVGTYTVKLIVRDAAGKSDTNSITVTVEEAKIPAHILWVIGGLIGIVVLAYIVRRQKRGKLGDINEKNRTKNEHNTRR